MFDPIPPIPTLQQLVTPICHALHLDSLPSHIHEIVGAVLVYHIIFEYLAAPISNLFFAQNYRSLSRESKLRWNMHCASMVSCCFITTCAASVMYIDGERRGMNLEQRVWGYTGAAAMVQAFATGYFVFDLLVMMRYHDVFGTGMLMHAVSCVITYTLGFVCGSANSHVTRANITKRPVFNYYGCVFLLYELSTPFLNIHWFTDKLHLTGTKIQLYNGIMLVLVFFSCRIVWGTYASYQLWKDIFEVLESGMVDTRKWKAVDLDDARIMRFGHDRHLPMWVLAIYGIGHLVLTALNFWWFGKMIMALRKRFVGKPGQAKIGHNGTAKGESVVVEGVEILADGKKDI